MVTTGRYIEPGLLTLNYADLNALEVRRQVLGGNVDSDQEMQSSIFRNAEEGVREIIDGELVEGLMAGAHFAQPRPAL
ncbi:hypothetical protein D3C85_1335550 [compost metagenome]